MTLLPGVELSSLPVVVDNARSQIISFTQSEAPRLPALRPYSFYRYHAVTKHPSCTSSRWESSPASPTSRPVSFPSKSNATCPVEGPCRRPARHRSFKSIPNCTANPARHLSSIYLVLDNAPRQPKRSPSPSHANVHVESLEQQHGRASAVNYFTHCNITSMAA